MPVEEAVGDHERQEHADREECRGDADRPGKDTAEQRTEGDRRPRSTTDRAEDSSAQMRGDDLRRYREQQRIDRACDEPGECERDERDRQQGQCRERQVGERYAREAPQERAPARQPMPDRAVHEGADQRSACEDAEHEPEVGGAPVLLPREDGCHHRERRFQEVCEEHREDDGSEDTLPPDEPHALGELGEEPAPFLGLGGCGRPWHEHTDERRRDEEAGSVQPQRRRRAEGCDEYASDRRSHQERALLNSRADSARALHAGRCELDDVGEKRRTRGCSRSVQERPEKHERQQLPQLDAHGRV
jgi:hypothetical protein